MDRQKAGGQPVTLDMVMGDLLAAAYQDGKAGRSADIIHQLCDEWDRRHADDPVALKAGILCRSELMRAYRLGQAAGRRMDRVKRSSSPAPPEKYITEWRTTEMELMHDYLRAARVSEAFEGAVGLEAVKQLAADSTVNTCPFCGGEALVALTQHYGAPTARIECSRCHVGYRVVLSDVGLPAGAGDQLRGGIFAGRRHFRGAVSRWNRREADG